MLTRTSLRRAMAQSKVYGETERHHFGGPMDYQRHQRGREPRSPDRDLKRKPRVEPTVPGWYRQKDEATGQYGDVWREKAGPPNPHEPLEDDYLRVLTDTDPYFAYVRYYSPTRPT